jgi:branched-chain amino acid transport system substrate-binding protein
MPRPGRLAHGSATGVAGVLLLVTACSGAAASPPVRVGGDVLVGVAVSLTGSLAAEGRLTQQGYLMWQDWVNGQGGVRAGGYRHRVHILFEDDRSRPDVAADLAAGLVTQEHVQFLLAPYGSDATAAVAAVAEQHRVPHVAGNGAARTIYTQGYRYTFGVQSPSDSYMSGVLDMAARLSPRPMTIALLSADDSFSLDVADSVKTYAPTLGFRVMSSQQYPAGATDVTALVARAAATSPDVLINSGHLAEAVAIHRAARALDLNARIFAYSVGPSTPDFVSELGPDADYVLTGSQWTPQVRYRPQMYLTVPEYTAGYRRMFHTLDEPAYQVAEATAAGLALQRAMESAGTLDPQRVRDALASLDVMTFYGRLKFDRRGVNVYKPMLVEQIQRSRPHTVYPLSVADARVLYPTPAWGTR